MPIDETSRRSSLGVVGAAGLLGVVLYVGATMLGSLLDPQYSHVRNAISELTGARAPHFAVLAPLYAAYNILLVVFAVGLYRGSLRSTLFKWGAWLFTIGAISGIGQVTVFRMDHVGSPATLTGQGHIILAAVSSLLTVAATVVYGFAFRRDPMWRPLSRPSFIAAVAFVVTGPAAALSVGGPYMGLFERITIGLFIAWVAVVSSYALWQRQLQVDATSERWEVA